MRFVTFLSIVLLAANVQAAGRIFPIGDSILEAVYSEMVDYPPDGYIFDTTGEPLKYDAKRLHHWMAGRGTGVCDNESRLYGCLEAAQPFEIVFIFELGYNDIFNWYQGRYADIAQYIATWRIFYENIHSDFPEATIVHATGYPLRVDGSTCPQLGDIVFYGGDLTAIKEPDCQTLSECFVYSNGMYRGFKERLLTANSDLDYVHYIDNWEGIAAEYNEEGLETWHDENLPDCIHPDPEQYREFWDTWLNFEFEQAVSGAECYTDDDCAGLGVGWCDQYACNSSRECVPVGNPCAEMICDEAGDRCVACLEHEHCPAGYICNDSECVPRGNVIIDKCKVKTGKGNRDSIKFSGRFDGTEADFFDAIGDDVIISIEAKHIPDPSLTSISFKIIADYIKKGKFQPPKTKTGKKTGPVAKCLFDTNKGKLKFSVKNVNFTGLACPITLRIQFGDYLAETIIEEDIVNGPKKPCPPELTQ